MNFDIPTVEGIDGTPNSEPILSCASVKRISIIQKNAYTVENSHSSPVLLLSVAVGLLAVAALLLLTSLLVLAETVHSTEPTLALSSVVVFPARILDV